MDSLSALHSLSTFTCFAMVWLLLLHLRHDRFLRQRLRTLRRQEGRLMHELRALLNQETWVWANTAYAHAPLVLVAVTVPYHRTVCRTYHRHDALASRQFYQSEAHGQTAYRVCFDPFGLFGEAGDWGHLADLPDLGCLLLKLNQGVLSELLAELEIEAQTQTAEPLERSGQGGEDACGDFSVVS